MNFASKFLLNTNTLQVKKFTLKVLSEVLCMIFVFFVLRSMLSYTNLKFPNIFFHDRYTARCYFDTNYDSIMDDFRFRKIFNLGITKDISRKKLSKLEKRQSLVAKCCKIRKI